MTSKFIPNSFQIPNALVDEYLERLSGKAIKCYLLIARKTTGWHKSSDHISTSQFMGKCGIKDRKTAYTAIEELEAVKLVNVKRKQGEINKFSLNFFIDENDDLVVVPKNGTSTKKSLTPVPKNGTSTSTKKPHSTKDTIKNTITNNINTAQIDNSDELENAFDIFWKVYKVKVNKAGALKSFKSAYKKYSKNAECTVQQFAQMLADDVQRRLAVGQFGFDKLHPTTYLNNERWEDETVRPVNSSNSTAFQDNGEWSKDTVIVQDADGKVRVLNRNEEGVL
ncbi:replication protein [Pasteurella multocida]|uniref:replication protein n=1 Tax=Pasteurella multocida TaxID=747 RepID=UPI001F53AFF0|nr:replication protein [Pasteurella multocida]